MARPPPGGSVLLGTPLNHVAMNFSHGSLGRTTRSTSSSLLPAALRVRRSLRCGRWGVLLTALLLGCGDDSVRQKAAHDEALAAVEREKVTLKNMQAEQQRIYGEYLLHDFEGRIWAGTFVPSEAWGISWSERLSGDDSSLRSYLRTKLPHDWLRQLDRLLREESDLMPWYDRTQGELYRRRIRDRYSKLLDDIRDRLALQSERVRNAQEYARLLDPATTE